MGRAAAFDLAHRGRQVVELRRRKIGECRKCGDPTRIHGPLIVPHGAIERDLSSPASCRYVAAGSELAAAVLCDDGDRAKTRADLARVQLSPAPRTH